MSQRGVKDELSGLEQVAYCVNEFDEASASIGSFLYDTELHRMRGKYFALSNVFTTKDDLLDWARTQGFRYHCVMKQGWIGRSPC
jgi:hypothetical protein